jgi:hypothetical protein
MTLVTTMSPVTGMATVIYVRAVRGVPVVAQLAHGVASALHLPHVIPAMAVVNRRRPLTRLPASTTVLVAALTGMLRRRAMLGRVADSPAGVAALVPVVVVVVGV